MIKMITIDSGPDAKKLWKELKEKVDDSTIMHIEVEHETMEITELPGPPELMYTGGFEIKVRCIAK